MRLLYCYFFILLSYSAMGQTKQQLINAIIQTGEYIDEDGGQFMGEPRQYANFRKLNAMVTPTERLELSRHKNSVVRMYFVTELIRRKQLNAADVLAEEFRRNETVKEISGCLIGDELTSSFVYHYYWNELGGGSVGVVEDELGQTYEPNPLRDSVFRAEKTMMKMDSIVLHQDNAYWLLYDRAFGNRNFPETYLPRIEELAFKHNNSYAMNYLITNYRNKYNDKVLKYWREDFPKAEFRGYNSVVFFVDFIKMILQTKDEELKKIAVSRLTTVKGWENHGLYFIVMLKDNYGIFIPGRH